MAEEKKETKKSVKKTKAIVQPPLAVVQEDIYPAVQIAEILGIASFDFFMIKNAKNIEDSTLLTMTEFQKLYKEAIEGR